MNDLPNVLFGKINLQTIFDGNLEQGKRDIDGLQEERFTISTDEEIVEHVYSKRQILPLELHEDAIEMEMQETKVDVRGDLMRGVFNRNEPCFIPGIKFIISIPFSGNAKLWQCRPSTFNYNPPRAIIHPSADDENGCIELVFKKPSDTLDEKDIEREKNSTLNSIRTYLGYVKNDVTSHNQMLLLQIKQYVENRRQRLGKHAEVVKALNIPLKKKQGAPDISVLPIKRRLIRPLPSATSTKPEPGISNDDYEYILKVIRHEGRTFETTPSTFIKHDEEELRNIILAHLNGHYNGLATGETFRRNGKTDIRIEDDRRAAFIAECKIWYGQAELVKAIDQLLGYLTWRDCKTALIIFNFKNANFTELQAKLLSSIKEHQKFVKEITTSENGEWRLKMHSLEDDKRMITLHVFLFNLYVNN